MQLNSRTTPLRSITTLLLTGVFLALQLLAVGGQAAEVAFSYIKTGSSSGAQEAMVVKGGSWFKRRHLAHGAILIRHPQGYLLYDTGLGRQIDRQFEVNSWWAKPLFAYEKTTPVADQLQANQFDFQRLKAIIVSHLHWDHASGLEDFPEVPVWVQRKEYEAARKGKPPAFLQSQIDSAGINWEFLQLQESPFKGFSRSLDIFGDGTVVLVEIAGHTRGQLGLFLSLSETKQYFFIGDTTWTLKGVVENRPRPAFVHWFAKINDDDALAAEMVSRLHSLHQQEPDLTIVPAHDERVAAQLPQYPAFSN